MNVSELEVRLRNFTCNPPATDEQILEFVECTNIQPPLEYVEFLKFTNGGQGLIGEHTAILWPIHIVEDMNVAYQVNTHAAGMLIIGSNGCGEAIAFNYRDERMAVVSLPFVGMELSLAEPLAANFDDFLAEAELLSPYHGSTSSLSGEDMISGEGEELFEILPVILGGDPIDPANKVWLSREQHIETVRYWNSIISELRGSDDT